MFFEESVHEEMYSQTQSRLLRLPVEIRRHVYSHVVEEAVHVYLHNGRVCVSTCLTPQPSDDYFCFDRRSSGDPPGAVWARRLDSPWALHWRCEEVALGLASNQVNLKSTCDPARALMQSCKRVYDEMTDLLAEKSILHITDLATLEELLGGVSEPTPGNQLASSMPRGSFARVRRLRLAFRLPLAVYKMIELQVNLGKRIGDCLDHKPPAAIWMDIWPAVSKLKRLQSLEVYLDHDSEGSWTLVNETSILCPLLSNVENSRFSTTISVPTLPLHEKGDAAEFISIDSLSTISVQRFVRQRFFTERRRDGTFGIVYEDDANNMFHHPSPSADELARTAEMTMHLWLHGIDLDYREMSQSLGSGC